MTDMYLIHVHVYGVGFEPDLKGEYGNRVEGWKDRPFQQLLEGSLLVNGYVALYRI